MVRYLFYLYNWRPYLSITPRIFSLRSLSWVGKSEWPRKCLPPLPSGEACLVSLFKATPKVCHRQHSTSFLRRHLYIQIQNCHLTQTYKWFEWIRCASTKLARGNRFLSVHPVHVGRDGDSLRAGRSGDSIPVGGDIFRIRPGRHWGPLSLLYNGYRASLTRIRRPRLGVDHPAPSSAEVKERV